ncbi:MAG: hypothetical protein MI922_20580, partial [Bacteroidales bacterium]|nr:hypothetical protein [Bacteroidales bacterium]
CICCEIVDDGIGRKASMKETAANKSKHKSTGISVTRKRLEQLGLQTQKPAGVEIVDLIQNNHPEGTKVIITIPFELD